jgi:hypothetical protein
MLTCVYHPIDPCRVVESDEADKLQATGVWFDCPNKARNYRAKVEDEINKESKVAEKSKVMQSKGKQRSK